MSATEINVPLEADDAGTKSSAAPFALNPMSADDPTWIGHGFGRSNDDFLSSPEWTDPSPALTDSLSFDFESASCNTSPLFADTYDGDFGIPGVAGVPLFSPCNSANTSPNEGYEHAFPAESHLPDLSSLPLFPDAQSTSPKMVRAEKAFSRGSTTAETPADALLRALTSAALSAVPASETAPAPVADSAPLTASPLQISSPPTGFLVPAPVSSAPDSESAESARPSPLSRRGTKRRLDVADLLPLDAPIQRRTYKTPSATSRKERAISVAPSALGDGEEDPFAAEAHEAANHPDPLVSKRLSNTLAARRSRHRKAQELKALHDQIESLHREVGQWKARCERAEAERDRALVGRV